MSVLCEVKGISIMNNLEKQGSQSYTKKVEFNKSLAYPEVLESMIQSVTELGRIDKYQTTDIVKGAR